MSKTVVSKFGGSSMGTTEAINRSARVASMKGSSVVVVSATYGTTNQLVKLVDLAKDGLWDEASVILTEISERHHQLATELNCDESEVEMLHTLMKELTTLIRGSSLLKECSPKATDKILSMGERLSSLLYTRALNNEYQAKAIDKTAVLFDVRKVLITDENFNAAAPIVEELRLRAMSELANFETTTYVTQGFTGQTLSGETTTLGRGGSDYSASLLGEAINADLVEIWTDVAGIATTDPRIVCEAKPIHHISYQEASEMAQYGAKVLHPTTLVPAMRKDIPVFVGSSFEPEAQGTWISKEPNEGPSNEKPKIRSISKKSAQTLLTIRTPEMLNAVGFLARIFAVFERHQVSVDSVTTSEISVAVTVDQGIKNNKAFLEDLGSLGKVSLEPEHALISLIGNNIQKSAGLSQKIFNSVDQTNVRMICMGASDHNFNFLVKDSEADKVIQTLHRELI